MTVLLECDLLELEKIPYENDGIVEKTKPIMPALLRTTFASFAITALCFYHNTDNPGQVESDGAVEVNLTVPTTQTTEPGQITDFKGNKVYIGP